MSDDLRFQQKLMSGILREVADLVSDGKVSAVAFAYVTFPTVGARVPVGHGQHTAASDPAAAYLLLGGLAVVGREVCDAMPDRRNFATEKAPPPPTVEGGGTLQ